MSSGRTSSQGSETISHFAADELEPAQPDDMAAALRAELRARARRPGRTSTSSTPSFFGISPQGSRGPRSAAASVPGSRVGGARARRSTIRRRFAGPIGVFAGMTNNTLLPAESAFAAATCTSWSAELTTMMGNEKDYLATRVSYKLDLRGPGAQHPNGLLDVAGRGLHGGSEPAHTAPMRHGAAGGVSISVPQNRGYLLPGRLRSPRPTGIAALSTQRAPARCSATASASWCCGACSDALERRRHDLRRHQGCRRSTTTALEGQLHRAERRRPGPGDRDGPGARRASTRTTISYVEAHGTGTPLGDPIEIAGLTQAFRAGGATATATARSVRSRPTSATSTRRPGSRA